MVQLDSSGVRDLSAMRTGRDPFFPLIEAVINGSQEGKIFVDNPSAPALAFVITKSGFSKFYTHDPRRLTPDVLGSLYNDQRLPYYFHIYDPAAEVLSFFSSEGYSIRNRQRVQLRYNRSEVIPMPGLSPSLRVVDCSGITEKQTAPLGESLVTRFWPSFSAFQNTGFGKCVVSTEGEVLSICFSAAIADGVAEIDVATLAGHQSKGLGKTSTIAFVNEAISRGVTANWDCFTDNSASLKIAEALDFEVVRKYTLLSIYNKERHEAQKVT